MKQLGHFVLLLLPAVSGAQSSVAKVDPALIGQWSGKIVVDRERMFKDVKSQDHRKLLEYAIGRMAAAKATLFLYSNGKCQFLFDDGYRPDRSDWRGVWRVEPEGLTIRLRGYALSGTLKSAPLRIEKVPTGVKLARLPGLPQGLSATFVQVRKAIDDPPWTFKMNGFSG